MLKHITSVVGFMVISFGVQGLSHFVINKAHFDGIGFARDDPIIALGLLVMVIQGVVMSLALSAWRGPAASIADGVVVSLPFGLFLVAYIALVEPSKYAVPPVSSWLMVEGSAGLIQFALFGLLLGLVHKNL